MTDTALYPDTSDQASEPVPPQLYFSASSTAFYDLAIWPHPLPEDAVPIEPQVHAQVLDQLALGKVLQADATGAPVALEPPAPDARDLAASARRQRDALIDEVQWLIERHRGELSLQITPTLTDEDYLLVLRYVQDLRDVPEQDSFPHDIQWPTLPEELLATGA